MDVTLNPHGKNKPDGVKHSAHADVINNCNAMNTTYTKYEIVEV
jgi:hypothetical protein